MPAKKKGKKPFFLFGKKDEAAPPFPTKKKAKKKAKGKKK